MNQPYFNNILYIGEKNEIKYISNEKSLVLIIEVYT